MGMGAMFSYLNPKDASPVDMWRVVAEHGHFSVGHTAQLSFLLAGHSCAVENELNCQRDVVHLARLTCARTLAQKDPPLVVARPELAAAYASARTAAREWILAEAKRRPQEVSIPDWQEALYTAWPAAKAQVALLTGSVRALQKLVGAIDDNGKETEYRALLWQLSAALHALLPDMFRPNSEYKWRPPECLLP